MAEESTLVYMFQSASAPDFPDGARWWWHIKAANGEIVAASAYGEPSEEKCRAQVDGLVDTLWDNVEPEYSQDSAGEWRWLLTVGEFTRGRSSEGFVERRGAQENFDLAKNMLTRPLDIEVRDRNDV